MRLIGRKIRFSSIAIAAVAWSLVASAQTGGGSTAPEFDYGYNALRLEITGVNAGVAFLKLHGTQAGVNYQIMASQGLAKPTWTAVESIAGAPGVDWRPVAIALGNGLKSVFFWARVQAPEDRLWLEIPTNALAAPQQMTVVLHNTIPDMQYDVLTKAALTDPVWTTEGTVYGAPGGATPITLSRNGRPTLFARVRSGDDTSASAYWTTDSTDLTADRVTALYSGGASGLLTADTTRVSADIRK